MKEIYLDIMEKALSAYSEERIRDYIDEVKRDGLTEHGFPRLGVNIGILIAYGRRTELLDTCIEILDICCDEMPRRKAANDFSIREVCCCLMLFEEKQIVDKELIKTWKSKLAAFDPWNFYDAVDDHSGKFMNNWALFAAVSEYIRGVYCGIDTSEFVDWQLPCQLANLDCNDMYQDEPPYFNHMNYDLVPRFLFAFLLRAGYKGKYAARIEEVLEHTADFTLKMQSVTGETSFGGRSNQFVNNEGLLSSYCEMEAARFAEKGDLEKAGEFKAAALLAAESIMKYLNLEPISHVKNRYDLSTRMGCEGYGYFNKYMITVASNVYLGFLCANDSVEPTVAPASKGGYVIRTSEQFHKTFLSAGGYHAEIETNADFRYDASGLGRVHKKGCPSMICLSLPFPTQPHYILLHENPTGMSICCYAMQGEKKLLGAENYAEYHFVESQSDSNHASAVFDVKLADAVTVTHQYSVSENGVDISLTGYDDVGFMLPVFDFDGAEYTDITVEANAVSVKYKGSVCRYSFDGEVSSEFDYYYNRNGRYRVYSAKARNLHIEISEV